MLQVASHGEVRFAQTVVDPHGETHAGSHDLLRPVAEAVGPHRDGCNLHAFFPQKLRAVGAGKACAPRQEIIGCAGLEPCALRELLLPAWDFFCRCRDSAQKHGHELRVEHARYRAGDRGGSGCERDVGVRRNAVVGLDGENDGDLCLVCERAVGKVGDADHRCTRGLSLLQQLDDLDATPAAGENDESRTGGNACGMEQLRRIEKIDRVARGVKVPCCAERGVVAGADAGEIDVARSPRYGGGGLQRLTAFAAETLDDTSQLIRLTKYVLKEMGHLRSSIGFRNTCRGRDAQRASR